MQFRNVFADGVLDQPRKGDRVVYDRTNGTLTVYRSDADVTFSIDDLTEPAAHVFVGRNWGSDLTRAAAELYARLGNLGGRVVRVEGSFPSLETWELVG